MVSEETHWAIIIGVGAVVPKPKAESSTSSHSHPSAPAEAPRTLRGALVDVKTIKEYLATLSMSVSIDMLTDGSPSDSLPTWKNVTSRLRDVIMNGKEGDFVYIHFSGHGTHSPIEQSDRRSQALALALFDKYLYGDTLRLAVQRMVEKGMQVTLVLDCCFSGRILRNYSLHGATVRFMEYDASMTDSENAETDQDNCDALFAALPNNHDLRKARMQSKSILDPDGYTVITACGPHELATEMDVDGDRRGALSYFLISALQTLKFEGTRLSQDTLYQHISAMFHAHYPEQTPMRYGRHSGPSFFASLANDDPGETFVSMFKAPGSKHYTLNAGQAHGVHLGDEYRIRVYNSGGGTDAAAAVDQAAVKMVVHSVECLTSEIYPADASVQLPHDLHLTWRAERTNSLARLKVRMRLKSSLPGIEELQSHNCKAYGLSLVSEEDTEPCSFTVSVNDQAAYEVLDGYSQSIHNLPTIPLTVPGAVGRLADMLQHIATFKFFERIQSQDANSLFDDSFEIRVNNPISPSGFYEVKHGETWSFTFENRDRQQQPKYLTVFNFDSDWEVSNVLMDEGDGDYLTVLPETDVDSGSETVPMTMTVPAEASQVEDIVKVFVTSKPTRFPAMVLPSIGQAALRSNVDELTRFLDGLLNQGNGMRGQGYWTCRNYIIRTSV